MRKIHMLVWMLAAAMLAGCGSIQFKKEDDGEGLLYYEPQPYYQVIEANGTLTTSIVMLPTVKKRLAFKSGIGSSALSVTLSNGMITTIGQTTDPKIPELTTAFTGLLGAAVAMSGTGEEKHPTVWLYKIENGKITPEVSITNGKVTQTAINATEESGGNTAQ